MTFDGLLNYLGWTHGDFGEFARQFLLYSIGLALAAFRPVGFKPWRYFSTLGLMTFNLGVARAGLGFDPENAWVYCTASQAMCAATLFVMAETWVGMVVGAFFGVMIAGAGLTVWGIVSPLPSIGLAANYWSIMSVASFAQDATMLMFAMTFAGKRIWPRF